MIFKPLGKRVLVERVEEENKTSSGLIIPDNATKEKPSSGIVKEISKEIEKSDLKQGDKVLFGKYKGDEVKIDGKDFIILEIEDILGILK